MQAIHAAFDVRRSVSIDGSFRHEQRSVRSVVDGLVLLQRINSNCHSDGSKSFRRFYRVGSRRVRSVPNPLHPA